MTKYELTVQTVDNSYTYNYNTDLEAIIDAYAFERGDMVPDESKNEEILSMKVVEVVAPGGMVGRSSRFMNTDFTRLTPRTPILLSL